METERAMGEKVAEAGMALDEMVSVYGIRVVLAGLTTACEGGGGAGDWTLLGGPQCAAKRLEASTQHF
jgi:hypothetical protein